MNEASRGKEARTFDMKAHCFPGSRDIKACKNHGPNEELHFVAHASPQHVHGSVLRCVQPPASTTSAATLCWRPQRIGRGRGTGEAAQANKGWLDGGLGGFRPDTNARWQCLDQRVPGKRGEIGDDIGLQLNYCGRDGAVDELSQGAYETQSG